MYFVRSGEGFLHMETKRYPLKQGDVFFTFPGEPFGIESGEGFTYYYITFIGLRGNQLLEICQVKSQNPVFHDGDPVAEIWKFGMQSASELSSVSSEAVLLYTFLFWGNQLYLHDESQKTNDVVAKMKKYVEDHYFESDFSLEQLSRELSYNAKYLSHVFKKRMNIGIIEYLNEVRIKNARMMIAQGFTSISDIASQCGYSDAQYFSKLFKRKTGNSPKYYMNLIMKNKS